MNIQWFPGHMHNTQLALRDLVKKVDVVIEMLDARAPFSSCNPLLQSIIQHKPKIRLLNKNDLADTATTNLWLKYFKQQDNTSALSGNMYNSRLSKQLLGQCKKLAPTRNTYAKPLRIMISGIPNVGKSTLINQLLNKKSAKTGDIPALTRQNKCFILTDEVLIYDTPGIMWHNIQYSHVGYHLALCNSIGSNAIDFETLALYLINYLKQYYPQTLITRYKLSQDLSNQTADMILDMIASQSGIIGTQGLSNKYRMSELILQDFRQLRFGRISLETPDMWQQLICHFSVNPVMNA